LRLWVKGYSSYWAETVFTLQVTVTLTFVPLTPKSKGFFYLIRAITLWRLKALDQRVLELLSGNGFHSSGHCDLYLWPTDPKSVGVFYYIRAITLWSLKALGQRVLELLSGNVFHSLGHCDLDLWPTDPKINRGLLLNKGYHPIKFEGSGPKGIQVIERKRFSLFGSLWPWPLTYWPQNQ